MDTLFLSDQYREYIVGQAQVGASNQANAPAIDPSTLSGQYLNTFNFVSGLLQGSSYMSDGICAASLNGMVYYGLKVYQSTQSVVPNPLLATINGQKLSEQYAIFFA